MKDTFIVFYAWQSDHPGGQCRFLVQEALEAAAKAISDDPSIPIRIEVDQDTKGVPGLCDIPATILAKIEKCDAIVADLTYVAKSSVESPRFCSNPNVLFEVGFAFHAVGPERLILVRTSVMAQKRIKYSTLTIADILLSTTILLRKLVGT
jgi:hypothetical protein